MLYNCIVIFSHSSKKKKKTINYDSLSLPVDYISENTSKKRIISSK